MNEENRPKFTTKTIVMIGVFAALIAVLSQVSIQTPWQMPITLQTFAVALAGYSLGKWKSTMSVFIWVIMGAVGVPVFANFTAGLGKIAGPTGGFMWGFLFLAFGCGLYDTVKKKWIAILLGILGLLLCHLLGVLQFAYVGSYSFGQAFLLASAPYLIKDAISVGAAYGLAIPIRKVMNGSGSRTKKPVSD